MFLQAIAAAIMLLDSSIAAAQQYGAMPLPDLSTRYLVQATAAVRLVRRDAQCAADWHNCREIDFPDNCCPDTKYCQVKKDGYPATRAAQCCPLGSVCDSPCAEDKVECTHVQTTTVSGAATATTQVGCCNRACKTASFRCPDEFGGGCCGFGQTCASGGHCLVSATGQQTAAPRVTMADPACPGRPDLFACDDGEPGCCSSGMACTVVGSTGLCTKTTVAPPTGSGFASVQADTGLSSGAKAGIGAGVAIGACLVIGALTFWVVRRRRKERSLSASHPDGAAVGGGGGGGGGDMPGPLSDTSEMPAQGHTVDYFGPDAVAGPYTETGPIIPPRTTEPRGRVVGTAPEGPGDIHGVAEMDTNEKSKSQINVAQARQPHAATEPYRQVDTLEGRFELPAELPAEPLPSPPYGTEALVSPRSEIPSPRSEMPSPTAETLVITPPEEDAPRFDRHQR